MIWVVLVIAVWLTPEGPPTAYAAVLLPGVPCTEEVARAFVDHVVDGKPYVRFVYSCDNARGPEPVEPSAVPQDRGA